MHLDSGDAGKGNRTFFAQTDPNQFLICEKALRTLEENPTHVKTQPTSPTAATTPLTPEHHEEQQQHHDETTTGDMHMGGAGETQDMEAHVEHKRR